MSNSWVAHKWELSVQAGAYYISLCREFVDADIALSYQDEEPSGLTFFAYSKHIDLLSDPHEVLKRIQGLELLLNGALRLQAADFDVYPIRFTGITEIDTEQAYDIRGDIIEEVPFEPRVVASDQHYLVPRLVNTARKDDVIRQLLLLIGLVSTRTSSEKILCWSVLYRLHDAIGTFAPLIGKKESDFIDKADLNRFTAACNNMSVLGLFARHGPSANLPPIRIMSDLGEAKKLILGMCSEFVREYLEVKWRLA